MRGAVVIRICEHCGESYRYAHTCPPPKRPHTSVDRLLIGKLRDVQRACVGLDELLREVEP